LEQLKEVNEMPNLQTEIEMPKYKCHKEVWALRISALEIHKDKSATIVPDDSRYTAFRTAPGWAEHFKGNEKDPGYYVVYKNSYASWSPTKAFEEGYSLIK
jgi:hypothetical protein